MRLAMSLPSSGFTGSWVSYIESQLKFQWLCVDIYLLRGCVSFNTKTKPPQIQDLFHLGELPACVFIIPKVLLVAHEDDWDIGTKVLHFRCPFLRNVL